MTIRSESGLTRRTLLTGGAFAGLLAAGALGRAWQQLQRLKYDPETELPSTAPEVVARVGAMPYRRFGATGLQVSEDLSRPERPAAEPERGENLATGTAG